MVGEHWNWLPPSNQGRCRIVVEEDTLATASTAMQESIMSYTSIRSVLGSPDDASM